MQLGHGSPFVLASKNYQNPNLNPNVKVMGEMKLSI
jgi:hypothetical protein